MARIVVVGSINMDVVTNVEHFPKPGETLPARSTGLFPGGKGANQAVAVARSGGQVAMVGAVGGDAFGAALRQDLGASGVNIDGVVVAERVSTGVAVITVDETGQNTILVSKGANDLLTFERVLAVTNVFSGCELVILQNEINPVTTLQVLEWCSNNDISVMYNPAPAMGMATGILSKVHTLVVNEHEATVVSGQPVTDMDTAKTAAVSLLDEGVHAVIVTLGRTGLVYQDRSGKAITVPAFPVHAVDTTAAGDTFIGAYATAVVERMDPDSALRFASAAASLSVTVSGAQTSIPNRFDIEQFLKA